MTPTKRTILIDEQTIAARVSELAVEISGKYPEGDLVLIGILKGAFVFLADLIRQLTVPCRVEFVRIATYGSGTVTSGKLDVIMDCQIPLDGKHVIVVDDIVDTGFTLSEYCKLLATRRPRSLEIAALLDKTARRMKHVELDYCGFRIPDGFIVGYGLDCDEQYRHLSALYTLEPSCR